MVNTRGLLDKVAGDQEEASEKKRQEKKKNRRHPY